MLGLKVAAAARFAVAPDSLTLLPTLPFLLLLAVLLGAVRDAGSGVKKKDLIPMRGIYIIKNYSKYLGKDL